jgi:hypothetical protein
VQPGNFRKRFEERRPKIKSQYGKITEATKTEDILQKATKVTKRGGFG